MFDIHISKKTVTASVISFVAVMLIPLILEIFGIYVVDENGPTPLLFLIVFLIIGPLGYISYTEGQKYREQAKKVSKK
ncbi:hypothetical protein KBC70_02460 [Candidatus Woesebacteria bacterium]|jgi:hypothetical protein|nr:hypothetical protein [Candidatus Woesebacteria bacterium]